MLGKKSKGKDQYFLEKYSLHFWVKVVRSGIMPRSLSFKDHSSHQNSQVSIYASPDKWSQTHYALEASLKLLDFYENYFDIHYPLPKLGRFKF